jgi:peptidoglycan/xylan/chitin deacetylase (PgdA/CDA1 family)
MRPNSRLRRRPTLTAGLFALTVVVATAVSPFLQRADAAAAAGNTLVSLTFDDGTQDQYDNARPLLNAHHMKATFYINSGRFGTTGYLSEREVHRLATDGHEIGGHTLTHPDLVTLPPNDQKRTICNDRVALLNLGLAVRNFAYPFGSSNASARQAAADCGYNSARTVGGIVSPTSCSGCPYASTIPPADLYRTRTPDSVKTGTTLADLKSYVRNAEGHGGGWVALVIHHVCNRCGDEYAISPALLGEFLDWLQPRTSSGTRVVTVDDVIGGRTKPAVPGPVLPPSLDGNLLDECATAVRSPRSDVDPGLHHISVACG